MNRKYCGFLLINKEPSVSSHAVLRPIKKLFDCKIGHTGTLDPMATGMLVCAVGESRKFIQYAQARANKCYQACIQLGCNTETSDITGTVISRMPVPSLSTEYISSIIQKKFIGDIYQKPPIYSALKYQGKPYYYYARRNETIPIQPRKVSIFSISDVNYDRQLHQINFKVLVSAGTYIRALAVDLASALDTIGCLASLHRIYADPWKNQPMYTLDTLVNHSQPEQLLLPIDTALPHYQRVRLTQSVLTSLYHGQIVSIDRCPQELVEGSIYLATDDADQFMGLVERRENGIKALRMLRME